MYTPHDTTNSDGIDEEVESCNNETANSKTKARSQR